MNRFFGHKSKKKNKNEPKPATLDDAGSNLDKRGKNIEEKINRLERQIIELKKKMKKAKGSTKNMLKQKAIKLLKQKKQYENQYDRVMGQQFNIDNIKNTQDSLKDNATMVEAMKNTAKTLKQQYKEIDIDEVEVKYIVYTI